MSELPSHWHKESKISTDKLHLLAARRHLRALITTSYLLAIKNINAKQNLIDRDMMTNEPGQVRNGILQQMIKDLSQRECRNLKPRREFL